MLNLFGNKSLVEINKNVQVYIDKSSYIIDNPSNFNENKLARAIEEVEKLGKKIMANVKKSMKTNQSRVDSILKNNCNLAFINKSLDVEFEACQNNIDLLQRIVDIVENRTRQIDKIKETCKNSENQEREM